jgi:hypothetical protein
VTEKEIKRDALDIHDEKVTIIPHKMTSEELDKFYCMQATPFELADLIARCDCLCVETFTGAPDVREGRYLSAEERDHIVKALRRPT